MGATGSLSTYCLQFRIHATAKSCTSVDHSRKRPLKVAGTFKAYDSMDTCPPTGDQPDADYVTPMRENLAFANRTTPQTLARSYPLGNSAMCSPARTRIRTMNI